MEAKALLEMMGPQGKPSLYSYKLLMQALAKSINNSEMLAKALQDIIDSDEVITEMKQFAYNDLKRYDREFELDT